MSQQRQQQWLLGVTVGICVVMFSHENILIENQTSLDYFPF